jgi:flavodoxin
MRTVVLYESRYGNTAEIAKAVAEDLSTVGPVWLASVEEGMPALDSVGLLVVCGPTHGHGISAALRTLLDSIPTGALAGIAAAAFDTRLSGPTWLTGSAATGIAKRLQQKGAHLASPSASFVVTGAEGPVRDADLARAHVWARSLVDSLARTQAASAPVV